MIATVALRSSIRSSKRSFIGRSPVESADGIDDFVELAAVEFREDGQRQNFLRRALGFGTAAFAVSEVREARLEMQRQWIVNRRANLLALQICLQVIAPVGANSILVEDRLVLGIDGRGADAIDTGQRLGVVFRILAAL